MTINRGLFSSATGEWSTPQALFDSLDAEFHFTLDPCATTENAKCAAFFTKEQDGLRQPWSGVVFCNPPYGRQIAFWIEKAWMEWWFHGVTVVLLIPARTDTEWWQNYIWSYDRLLASEIRFLKGRVRFGNGKCGAPFPSAIVVFRGR